MTARHIARVYRSASPDDHARGAHWYPQARALVTRWARQYRLPRATVANVIAAISPQCDWPTNKRLARAILAGGRPDSLGGALPLNLRKAAAIRDARATDVARYFPHGPKVQAFARNLMGQNEPVTIDRHMAAAAGAPWGSLTPNQYAALADCYRAAARLVQEEPATLQAIIWVSWRRRNPPHTKRSRRP